MTLVPGDCSVVSPLQSGVALAVGPDGLIYVAVRDGLVRVGTAGGALSRFAGKTGTCVAGDFADGIAASAACELDRIVGKS